jgi:hypothetical protein
MTKQIINCLCYITTKKNKKKKKKTMDITYFIKNNIKYVINFKVFFFLDIFYIFLVFLKQGLKRTYRLNILFSMLVTQLNLAT